MQKVLTENDLWLHVDGSGVLRLKCPCETVVHAWYDPQHVSPTEITTLSVLHVEGHKHPSFLNDGLGTLFDVVKTFHFNGAHLGCEAPQCGWTQRVSPYETVESILIHLMEHYHDVHLQPEEDGK